jgi:malate synthase
MPGPNQLDRLRRDVEVNAADLLKLPEGTITEDGLRSNVNVGIRYMAAWLSGNGCVPIFNLMEDAATAEISRAQIWQWIRHSGGVLDDGRRVTAELYKQVRDEELGKIQADVGDAEFAGGNYREAAELLDKITLDDEFIEFLTLVAYEKID